MIDHCEFPYGEPVSLYGDLPGLLLLILVFAVGMAVGMAAVSYRQRRRRRGADGFEGEAPVDSI